MPHNDHSGGVVSSAGCLRLDSQDNVPFSDEFQLGLSQFIQARGKIYMGEYMG